MTSCEGTFAQLANKVTGCCRGCGAALEHTFVDLGMSPLCESFLTLPELDARENYYPLHVYVCDKCLLVQLKAYVDPEEIFREYAYFSGFSSSWIEHAKTYCNMITERLNLGRDSLVVELASNDGYLLQHFGPLNVPALGIEPAVNVAKVAQDKGIETITEFFGVSLARELVNQGRSADLIVGNNVLAQVPDLNDFVGGIQILLKPEGVVTLEFPHLEKLVDENQFDTIYHEHFSYFSLLAMEHIARRHDLRIIDVEELKSHGGSLRVYLSRTSASHAVSPNVDKLLARERALGLEQIDYYTGFGEHVRETKRKLLALLIDAKDSGKTVCGYGAPGKGNTLLNYCGIGRDFLDFTVDRNPYKHGRYTPGMHIPILPPDVIKEVRPDYLMILPWNLKTEIMEQMSYIGEWGGKFIIPIPEAHIIEPNG